MNSYFSFNSSITLHHMFILSTNQPLICTQWDAIGSKGWIYADCKNQSGEDILT